MEMPRAHPRWGIEFDWLAIDSRGQVALFTTSGYGAVPEAVLRNASRVDEALQTIAQLPTVGTPTETSAPGDGDYSHWLTTAKQGIFAYDWTIWHGPYERVAIPSFPLTLDKLPPRIRESAELVDLSFNFANEAAIAIPYIEPEYP